MICSDVRLSDLDEEVTEACGAARSVANHSDAKVLQTQQLRWLAERNTCLDNACVEAAQEARLHQLHAEGNDADLSPNGFKCRKARCMTFASRGADEQLWNAATVGNLAGVRQALADGAFVDVCGSSYERPLHLAVGQKNAALVRELLSAKANPNVRNCPGKSPLTLAAFQNDVTIASLLLDARADPELGSPLHTAAFHGHVEILRLLLARGANPDAVRNNSTPLKVAAGRWQVEAVDLLLRSGANPNWTTGGGGKALFDAVGAFRVRALQPDEQEQALQVVRLLVRRGANVNDRTAGQSALQRARALNAPEIAGFLLASGAKE